MTPQKPLTCCFGTAWENHWKPPVGTGIGCKWCAMGAKQEGLPREEEEADAADRKEAPAQTLGDD